MLVKVATGRKLIHILALTFDMHLMNWHNNMAAINSFLTSWPWLRMCRNKYIIQPQITFRYAYPTYCLTKQKYLPYSRAVYSCAICIEYRFLGFDQHIVSEVCISIKISKGKYFDILVSSWLSVRQNQHMAIK